MIKVLLVFFIGSLVVNMTMHGVPPLDISSILRTLAIPTSLTMGAWWGMVAQEHMLSKQTKDAGDE